MSHFHTYELSWICSISVVKAPRNYDEVVMDEDGPNVDDNDDVQCMLQFICLSKLFI